MNKKRTSITQHWEFFRQSIDRTVWTRKEQVSRRRIWTWVLLFASSCWKGLLYKKEFCKRLRNEQRRVTERKLLPFVLVEAVSTTRPIMFLQRRKCSQEGKSHPNSCHSYGRKSLSVTSMKSWTVEIFCTSERQSSAMLVCQSGRGELMVLDLSGDLR